MSVDIRMNIGFGFVMPRERYVEMNEYSLERDTWCEIEDEFYCMDCYADCADYFLGELFVSTENVKAYAITDCVPGDFDGVTFANKYNEILEMCGVRLAEDWVQPKLLAFLSYS